MRCPRCEVPLLWAYSDVRADPGDRDYRRGHYAHLDTYFFVNHYRRLICHIFWGDV
jgi:hypothetical protein